MFSFRNVFLGLIYCVLMRNFLRIIVGVKFINKESLKKEKQFIIVANHNSHLDVMAIMSSLSFHQLKNTHPIAAGDYFGNSKFKSYITRLFTNAILIRRSKSNGTDNPIDAMNKAIQKGKSLILFPEGSRGEPGKMQEFKKGIGILLQMNPTIPFIPVYMKGMGKVLPKGEKLLVPFDTYVAFGVPILITSTDISTIIIDVEKEIINLEKKLA